MSERVAMVESGDITVGLPARLLRVGYRTVRGTWQSHAVDTVEGDRGSLEFDLCREQIAGGIRLTAACPGAAALELVFELATDAQVFGGGEQFETLDLRGQSVRYYLENFALGSGTYLPVPWLATTTGFGLYLADEAPAVFHVGAPFDPHMLRVQVEAERLDLEIHIGSLAELRAILIERIGPPTMPDDAFFGLWKAGDWRAENAETVAADVSGFAQLGLPMTVKLIDAYWESEVHSFAFDGAKYPDAWRMVAGLRKGGAKTYLWLCPWVVVGTLSFEMARKAGFLIVDAEGDLITRRPGANPNVVAALIDFSKPEARAWWSDSLRGLLKQGIAGFKADFGEQLPEQAVLASGETDGRAHNAFVRHYLDATIAAFDGRTPAIISRSGSPAIRTPIWTGDQTSDFCPKAGLPAAIRAVQSASLSGWPFVGSDLGGYFGTPTTQVFARWTQFACFTPLMMLHGLGCREPWDMEPAAQRVFERFAGLHLALRPLFRHYGRIAAEGGLPIIRMMPLAFPDTDWRGVNDWDQQFMLGEDLLVAPSAFYGDTRAVFLPEGTWYDVLAEEWVTGPLWRVHEVPLDAVALFVRAGARLLLATDLNDCMATCLAFPGPAAGRSVTLEPVALSAAFDDGRWRVERLGIAGTSGRASVSGVRADPSKAIGLDTWFGDDIACFRIADASPLEVALDP